MLLAGCSKTPEAASVNFDTDYPSESGGTLIDAMTVSPAG